MTQLQIKRVEKLLTYLRALPESKFDINKWVHDGSREVPITKTAQQIKYELTHPCGTTACVVGHLPVAFPRAFEHEIGRYLVTVKPKGSSMPGYENMLIKYFGDLDWNHIIYRSAYLYEPGIKDVIDRIEAGLLSWQPKPKVEQI